MENLLSIQYALQQSMAELIDRHDHNYEFMRAQLQDEINSVNAKISMLKKSVNARVPAPAPAKAEIAVETSMVKIKVRARDLSDVQRNIYKQQVVEDLQNAQKQYKHEDDTIYRLRTEKQPFAVEGLIKRALAKQEELMRQIDLFSQKIAEIEEGKMDDEILEQLEANRNLAETKGKAKLLKKQKQKVSPVAAQRAYTYTRYEPVRYDLEYKKYMKNTARFPEKLASQLEKMPNNRGFIFEGNFFYGKKSPIKPFDNYILTERVPTNDPKKAIFYEHVYTANSHKIYEMRGRNRELISNEQKERRCLMCFRANIPFEAVQCSARCHYTICKACNRYLLKCPCCARTLS